MFTRRALITAALLAVAAGIAVAVRPETMTTGSIGPGWPAVPIQGAVTQDGRVVGWATGARRSDRTIAFDAITEAKRFEPSRGLDFAGYRLSVLQVHLVRYPADDPAAGATFEQVVTEIKLAPDK